MPARRGLRPAVDAEGGRDGRRAAEPAALPLRLDAAGWCSRCSRSRTRRLLERQKRMYAEDKPLWQRYEQACDFLEDDLDSGYVRVLQEMIAAGWSNREIGDATRELLSGWFVLLETVVGRRPTSSATSARPPPRLATLVGRVHRFGVHAAARRGLAPRRVRRPADGRDPDEVGPRAGLRRGALTSGCGLHRDGRGAARRDRRAARRAGDRQRQVEGCARAAR